MLWAIDTHAAGNAEWVVIGGVPHIPGSTMLEKARHVRKNLDHLRTLLVQEPRGHGNMYASFVVPPTRDEADFGILFLEPSGYPTMCGHGTIGICTALVEAGMVEAEEPETEVILDTPAGLIRATVSVRNGKAEAVTFKNVPSFLYKADSEVHVPGLGRLRVDIAYRGDFYAILPVDQVGLKVVPEQADQLISAGTKIWRAVNDHVEVQHPEEPAIDCVT
jgi:proline racemase